MKQNLIEMKNILIQRLDEVRKKLHEIEEQEEDILKELDALEEYLKS